MAYLTAMQATALLVAEGSDSTWPSDAAEQLKHIERASRRIDAIPFKEALPVPRFKDGFYANSAGAITAVPMPDALQVATAFLALSYATDPNLDSTLLGSEGSIENSLAMILADLPLRVQAALYPYITDELKRGENQYTQLEIARINKSQSESVRSTATSIVYTGE